MWDTNYLLAMLAGLTCSNTVPHTNARDRNNREKMGMEDSIWNMMWRTLAIAAMLGICLTPVHAAIPKEYAVLVEATAVVSPPAVTLSWPLESRATGYEISRILHADSSRTSWGNPLALLPGTAISWTDNTVSVGIQYEYQIKQASTISGIISGTLTPTSELTSYGYVCAGIRIPAVDHRGTVVLIVDSTMAAPLSSELSRLRDDLVGDGWSVIRHDVARTEPVTSVKALIKTDYEAAPNEVKSVFLFGHIPVARSGDFAGGGHAPEHRGAFPADIYYGDMDGVWTDNTISNTNATYTDCWNVPGDGKFDQNFVPPGSFKPYVKGGSVELEVGRVDLWGLTSFLPKTETELLRQYLDKDHAYRHAITVLPRRGLITDHFGEQVNGAAWAQSGWRAWSSLFGADNTSEGEFGSLNTEPYLGYYLCGGGWNNSCDTITTANFAQQDPKAAFFMMFGSHFCDWNYEENIFRAPLATSFGLTNVYSGFPLWYLHTMSLGGTIGEATQLVQNNTYLDDISWTPFYGPKQSHPGEVHIALMGDPTLRLHAVKPVSDVTASLEKANVVIKWSASTDTVDGYYMYRSTSAAGPFTRITNNVITGTSFTDTDVSVDVTCTYMVRAIKLETSAGGTYYNSSQGIFYNHPIS